MANNINVFTDEDFLYLSGIQHMAFCERQWALIDIEQVWSENVRTVEGKHLHERTDDVFFDESRNDVRIVRAMPIVSYTLGLRGAADVVEFRKEERTSGHITVQIKNQEGWWRPVPVEYKRGHPKPDDRDAVQLCAQAIALEEMLDVTIEYGMLYYAQTRHREKVLLDQKLRTHTSDLARRMHSMFMEGKTPKAVKGKHCSQCSLVELCKPDLILRHRSVKDYIDKMCSAEVTDI